MKETEKASHSAHRLALYQKYLVGSEGIDVCCGLDPIKLEWANVRTWDMPDGDAQFLETIPAESMDWLYSSHGLEHMENVAVAFGRWARVVKSGGHLMIVVPSWTFYEQRMFPPSRFNPDHKAAFCACPMPDDSSFGVFYSIGEMIRLGHAGGLDLRECFFELNGFDFGLMGRAVCFDQTAPPFNAQAQLCFVFSKR